MHRRQLDSFLAQPDHDLADATELAKFVEHEADRPVNALIGIEFDSIVTPAEKADRHRRQQFTTLCLLHQGRIRALAQDRQLHLGKRALHAQQQSVVRLARVVDAIFVDDQRIDETAELEQRVPVATVARKPRGFDTEHCTHDTLA